MADGNGRDGVKTSFAYDSHGRLMSAKKLSVGADGEYAEAADI